MKSHVLAIEGVDWLSHDNGAKHKTNQYELVSQKKACIVRRGDVFNLALRCRDRAFDVNKDRVRLTFEFGTNPSIVKGTKAMTEMLQKRDFSLSDSWETLFDRRLGQRIETMVRIPSNAPVGLWRLVIDTWQGNLHIISENFVTDFLYFQMVLPATRTKELSEPKNNSTFFLTHLWIRTWFICRILQAAKSLL